MDDNYTSDFSHQKRTFISKLNPESPPFQPSSFYQHIQEVSQRKFSSENNHNYHLHIQPITNGYHDDQKFYSTTIHSVEPTEHHHVSQTHYIQEITSDQQHSTTASSHIEPVEETLTHSTSFDTQINRPEISTEIKAQRELDEDEIPPTEISFDQSSTHVENNTSSNELDFNIVDTRPLTELESPYKPHSNNESSTSFLPDVVAETLEQTDHDVDLKSEPDDILGNQSLLKQTITSGTADTRPARNTLATVSYKLFLVDSLTNTSRLIETIINESFFIGEYDILPAIDIVIQLMDRGEHALIDSDNRHCYGENGCEEKQVPPVTTSNPYTMKIDLEFHDWTEAPEIQTLSINQRLHWSDKKRQRGNFSYRRKDYSSALQNYRNALKFLDTNQHPILEEEEEQDSRQISILSDRYIQVQNNLAQVYLLNNQYEQCLEAVNDVLKHDSNNIKALFRQAKALFEIGNYDQAIQPLKSLLQNSSEEVDKDKVKEMLKTCEIKLAKYQKNEKEIYKRMFQAKTTTTTTIANESSPLKNTSKTESKNSNSWWTYVAMGSAILAAIGLAAAIKYR